MLTRTITGLLAGVTAILAIFFLKSPLDLSLLIALLALAYLEFDKLFFAPRKIRQFRNIVLITLTLIAMRQESNIAWASLWFSFICIALSNLAFWSQTKDLTQAGKSIALETLGYLYVLSLLGFLLPIRDVVPLGPYYLLLLCLIVFCGDTGAYFVGKTFGKRPLSPLLSPKKTIEGAVAGLGASLLISFIWAKWILPHPPSTAYLYRLFLFVPIASLLAQGGDLFESLLKRSQSQKDSGQFLPGHGGLLDRVDGLSLTSPVFYFYVKFVMEGL